MHFPRTRLVPSQPASDIGDRPLELARQLVRCGAVIVVVGGAARRLRGGAELARDLDLVVEPVDVDALVLALARCGTRVTRASLLRCRDVSLATAWGPVDVFVAVAPPALVVSVGDVDVRVAR
jgi:hypothetical protein